MGSEEGQRANGPKVQRIRQEARGERQEEPPNSLPFSFTFFLMPLASRLMPVASPSGPLDLWTSGPSTKNELTI